MKEFYESTIGGEILKWVHTLAKPPWKSLILVTNFNVQTVDVATNTSTVFFPFQMYIASKFESEFHVFEFSFPRTLIGILVISLRFQEKFFFLHF